MKTEERIRREIEILEKQLLRADMPLDMIIRNRIDALKWVLEEEE